MAAENLGDLYIRMGLSLSELETDLASAEHTVIDNVRRLNRESNIIRVRSEVEIAGLDESADAERILQIRTDALNRQMAIQRDRVRILTAELQSLTEAHGENSVAAQRMILRLERERLYLANLERESRRLGETSGETNNAFGELSNLLPEMPTKLGAAQMALGALTAGIGAAGAATKELLDEFRELQNQSYELNMSFPDTRNFLREMRLAGGDIGDYEGFIRGITDAYVKGEWDDPEFIALRKYGAEIVDATGRLKEFKDISEEVYQAWLKADEAGEGIEFLQLVGGESGVRDAIQLFQRLKEAREDAEKISKAGIDEEQLHKLDRTMNLATEQASELKAALGDIFVPTAQAAAERFFNVFQKGTDYLNENKDALQKLQFVAVGIFDNVAPKVAEALIPRLQLQARAEDFKKLFPDEKLNPDSPASKLLESFSAERFNPNSPISRTIENINEKYRAFKGELKDTNTVTGKVAEGLAALSEAQKKHGDVLSQYGSQRVQEFRDELEDLKIELEFGDDEYRKSRAQLDLWKNRESVYKNYLSEDERAVIDELYSAKLEQIEKEHRDKIAEAMQSNLENAADIEFEMTHTAFEKQIRDIERWEEAQREKAETAEEISAIIAESAAKEAQAFEDEMDRIKGKLQSLDDKIFAQEHSRYEIDLRQILQERLKYYEEGIYPSEKIERWFNNEFGSLRKRAAESEAKGGDYTKTPEGVMHGGGNGIVVIGADQIVDNGLISAQSREISLLTDENQIRAQLMPKLDAAARAEVEKIEATRALTDAQKDFIQLTQQARGFSLIEGDKFTSQPAETQIISGDQNIPVPAEELRQFSEALQQADPLQDLKESAQSAADVQKEFAEKVRDFPPDYFKQLADGTASLSEMQMRLTESTMKLIDVQSEFAAALKNLPNVNPSRDISNNQPVSNDGFLKLTKQDLRRETDARLNQVSDIPPQKQIAQKDSGMKFGFDMDMAGLVAGLGGLALMGATAPISAPVLGGVAITSLLAGLAKGSYDETNAQYKDYDERLKAMPANVDLSALETSLSGIGENVQSILQSIQAEKPKEADRLQELFGALPNIEEYLKSVLLNMQSDEDETILSEYFSVMPKISEDVQSILQSMQSKVEIPDAPALQQLQQMPEPNATLTDYLTPRNNIDGKLQSILQATQMKETISFETVITPLNSINALVGNILTTLSNRKPPQITVSPNNSINLGGAYVFDNALKQELVNDITKRIVDEITMTVRQATSQSSYGFGT